MAPVLSSVMIDATAYSF